MKSLHNTNEITWREKDVISLPTLLFGYDAKTDNKSDFHCEELTIENENL